jgi:cell surface protein SprA
LRFLLVIVTLGFLAHAGARVPGGPHAPVPDYDFPEDAPPDTPETLRFPISDKTGEPLMDRRGNGFDLQDPANIRREVEYDPETRRYYLSEKVGDEFIRNPTYLTYEEYLKEQSRLDEQAYWKRRLDALSLFNTKPKLPQMYREGIFDRIFGSNTIQVRPQGNVDVTIGGNWQNIQNPTLVQRAQKYGVFDFDLQMNISLLATVGDKLKLNISNNTKAQFDYQNLQKIEYTGKEDEILKKLEAGNVSFPLRSSLIQGVQSLFGLKTQLQFGRLWVTAALSQQKSKRASLSIQGGAQTQQFAIKADDYEENKNFLLGQYFRNNYNTALSEFPVIRSQTAINKIEVWVTNRTGAVNDVRDLVAFMDLGEATPYRQDLNDPAAAAANRNLPANNTNRLYSLLQGQPATRQQGTATNTITGALGLTEGEEFQRVTARKLQPSEYSFNPQLGYISLTSTPNPDDIVAVAYRYTYNGKTYQVGEFSEDLPPDSTNQKLLYLKLLKGTAPRVNLPIWDLMMKNVYALGGYGLQKEDFRLNILYQNPGGGELRYLPEGPSEGKLLLQVLNLDRLNFQNDPQPDGIFDYVEGITINPQQGKIIFPVLEPFGRDLAPAFSGAPQLERKYLYNILYDSTKTIARQFQQNNRYIMRGSYKSSSSSEIFLNAFNIPQGSVTVTAGGQLLAENQDYQIDYGIGRIKILNAGILNSGIPINIAYEDNATFGFQQQNFMGTRLDYYVNNKLTLGGTAMRLTERPFTQKVNFGEDPIKNTVLGLDATYATESNSLTRLLDKLPIYSTTAASFINASAEVAAILPGHPVQIDALDGGTGAVYIDDFEGSRSSYDLRTPASSWFLASTPVDARDANNVELFPEARLFDSLSYGFKRSKLAWYTLEPNLVDGTNGVPDFVKNDPNQHYVRLVQRQEVFPQASNVTLQNALATLDLGFYPKERGPYNYSLDVAPDGSLNAPRTHWGGIQRSIEYSDFEASNVEFMEFWVMDPYINNPTGTGGSLYINLGNVSEDVLKDSRKFFENGITYPKNTTTLDQTRWGYVPRFQQQITRAFDNDPAARLVQDVGYDGFDDAEEKTFYGNFLQQIAARVTNQAVVNALNNDPSSDNYRYYRDAFYDGPNISALTHYKAFNNPHGNSPVTDASSAYSFAATTIPESEDINRDNTLNESEDYFQYRVDMHPSTDPRMQVGQNFIVNKQTVNVKLPNGTTEPETWYQFKVPIREYQHKVGGIADFRSIRFMRMYLNGFEDSVILRFARLELGRNQWRRYNFSLTAPGENIPEQDLENVEYNLTSVSLEENSARQPIPYVIPPGVDRQQAAVSNGQNVALNEQALAMQVCNLKDGDARAAYKEVGVDMRQFERLRMFIHGESRTGQQPLRDGDVRAFIRIGSDFINNYYEYQIPLKITAAGSRSGEDIWPLENRLDLALSELVRVKTTRNNQGLPAYIPYSETDASGKRIIVVGNPNVGDAKTIMLGILNPKADVSNPADDGLPKCAEVWFNELRATGLNEQPGYAATGKVALQLADLGSMRLSGSMHTIGYGNIDQKLNQRQRDNFYQYDGSTNLNLGKLMPTSWGVQLPVFGGYSENVSTPQYDPYDLDVKLKDKLSTAVSADQRDSIRKAAQDYTSITSFNIANARITGSPAKAGQKAKPWSVRNFDASYSYNKQYRRNPLIEKDELVNQKLGLGYTYTVAAKPIEPFKKLITSRSKWWQLIKDFNFNPLPANFSFRTELNRTFDETIVRTVGGDGYRVQPTYYKNFTWLRTYNTRWELTRSLALDYNATNNSRIDEPYGRLDSKEKRDTVWGLIRSFGRNTYFTQSLNVSYNVPLSKLPLTDWMTLRLTYGTTYSWTAASRLAYDLGNTIANTQTKSVNGELNFANLYNKQRWLRAVNQPKPRTPGSRAGGLNGALGQFQKPEDRGQAPETKNPDVPQPGGGIAPTPITRRKGQPVDTVLIINNAPVVLAGLPDNQIDSLRKVAAAQDRAKAKAEAAKRKAERRAARIARRNSVPDVSTAGRVAGRLLTMVKRTTISYTENGGTVLPGFLDSTRILGVNTQSLQPGYGFAFGYQPGYEWLDQKAREGFVSRDSLFNGQFLQQFARNINITGQVEPFPDFRIDLSLTSTFSKQYSEIFKDTNTLYGRTGDFTHNNPYTTGSFTISGIFLKTLFEPVGRELSPSYERFLSNRNVISDRLGGLNPYVNGLSDPNDPAFKKGYTRYSQDVLVPAFLAAYSGKDAGSIPLVDGRATRVNQNPFGNYLPLPNWRLTYNGLTKIPAVAARLNTFSLTHGYTSTMAMNSFVSSLLYQDIYNLGFPSFIDSNSNNFIPFFQVPNVTVSEQLGPLLGIDVAFKNNLTARVEFRKSRTVSLSLIDYQIAERASTEYVFGLGYRARNIKLPFPILGITRLKNDLNVKVDVGIRDDVASNTYMAQNVRQFTGGQKVISISPSIDYIISDQLTLRFFYDRRQSIPYVSSSYPITTTRGGVTLRFIFVR